MFTAYLYHFLFLRYLNSSGTNFSRDILLPFPNSNNFNKKRSEISRDKQEKIMCNFLEPWFLPLEIPMGATQFCRIPKGEASICLGLPRVK